MLRSVCLCLVLLVPSGAAAQYRPLSLGDIVDAVGSNPEGMPTDELSERITTYAYFTSDDHGLGLAVRLASDPDGAIFVGWRFRNELWRYGWIEDETLGRLEGIRPAGSGFYVDTRHADSTGTAVVLRRDMTVLTVAAGIARLALPSGVLVLERANVPGTAGSGVQKDRHALRANNYGPTRRLRRIQTRPEGRHADVRPARRQYRDRSALHRRQRPPAEVRVDKEGRRGVLPAAPVARAKAHALHSRPRRLVAVVIRLVRTVDRHADVLRLLG